MKPTHNIQLPTYQEGEWATYSIELKVYVGGVDPIARKIMLGEIKKPHQSPAGEDDEEDTTPPDDTEGATRQRDAGGKFLPKTKPTAKAEGKLTAQQQEEISKWEERDYTAQTCILASCKPFIHQLSNFGTSAEMWSYLQETLGVIDYSTRIKMERDFANLQQGNSTLETFFNKVMSDHQRMLHLGIKIDLLKVFEVLIWGLNPRHAVHFGLFSSRMNDWVEENGGVATDKMLVKLKRLITSTVDGPKHSASAHSNTSGADDPASNNTQQPHALAASVSKRIKQRNNRHNNNDDGNKDGCSFCSGRNHQADDCFMNPRSKSYIREYAEKMKERKMRNANSNGRKRADSSNSDGMVEMSAVAQANHPTRRFAPSAYIGPSGMVEMAAAAQDGDTVNLPRSAWLVDSGSTSHCSHDAKDFDDLILGNFGTINIAGGASLPVAGKGTITLNLDINGQSIRRQLQDVNFVPSLNFKLFSVERALERGLKMEHTVPALQFYSTSTGELEIDTVKLDRTRIIRLISVNVESTITTPVKSYASTASQTEPVIGMQATQAEPVEVIEPNLPQPVQEELSQEELGQEEQSTSSITPPGSPRINSPTLPKAHQGKRAPRPQHVRT